jgi:hypothetical protein
MNQAILQIEQNILSLPVDEQLLLISRVEEKLRGKIEGNSDFENQLTQMANDENIQSELREVEKDFRRKFRKN